MQTETRPEPTFDELEAAWHELPAAPRDHGVVRHLVLRVDDGVHETPDAAELDEERGMVGDRWALDPERNRDRQLTLMRADVHAVIAAERQPAHAAGDNVMVDLDLSEEALPVGTQLRIGEAVVEVTAAPHLGCKKFNVRFGPGALKWVNWKPYLSRRLRGINARVVRAGRVAVGDTIDVIRH